MTPILQKRIYLKGAIGLTSIHEALSLKAKSERTVALSDVADGHNFIKQFLENGHEEIQYVPCERMVANIFTKTFPIFIFIVVFKTKR